MGESAVGLVGLVGACAGAGSVLAGVVTAALSGRTMVTARSRRRRALAGCAWAVLLGSGLGGVVVLVVAPAVWTVGFALLLTPLVVVAVCAVVVSLLQVRRYGRVAWFAVLLSTAGLLLVCGVGGVHGPEPLPLPGLLCLLWLPAPLIGCAFVGLHGLRAPGPMGAGRRVGAAIVAVAAGLTLTGFAALIVHGTSAYAVHYGTVATISLPESCKGDMFADDSVPFACSGVTWLDRGGNATTGTVYTDHRFWDRYGRYYNPGGVAIDPDDVAPPSVKITVYAVGDRAYMPGDTTTSARDAIGTPPLGSLAWAGLAIPVVLVAMLVVRVYGRRRVIGAAERIALGTARPAWLPVLAGLGAAALLLALGIVGVRSPDPWQLPGLVCLILAAGPLAAVAFVRVHRGGGPMTAAWRLVCVMAALAAVATATGVAAAVIVHSGVYAQRYGAAATMGLPRECRPASGAESSVPTAGITECTRVTWIGPHGRTVRGTLHVSRGFWEKYGGYYDDEMIVDYVQQRPLLRDLAAKIRFRVRVSGDDAYLPVDRSIAALGQPPLPWLSLAGVPLAAALLAGFLGRPPRPRRPHAATAGTGRSTARPTSRGADARRGGRVRHVTETSAFVRVSVDASGLRVQRRTRTAASGESAWRDHVNLGWDRIARMGFADERHGPTILYVLTDAGTRLYALDRRQLTGAQWRNIARAVLTATGGRITLDA